MWAGRARRASPARMHAAGICACSRVQTDAQAHLRGREKVGAPLKPPLTNSSTLSGGYECAGTTTRRASDSADDMPRRASAAPISTCALRVRSHAAQTISSIRFSRVHAEQTHMSRGDLRAGRNRVHAMRPETRRGPRGLVNAMHEGEACALLRRRRAVWRIGWRGSARAVWCIGRGGSARVV